MKTERAETYQDIEQMLDEKGWCVTPIWGVSMRPMLKQGRDAILINKPQGRLKPYDVAIYKIPGKYIVHRVLEVRSNHYIIRGDNCISLEYVPDSRVIGVLKGFWRGEKYIDVTDARYLRYAHFWVAINPLVKLLRYPRIIASRIFHRIFGPDVHPFRRKKSDF